jgi:hypothetical protein
MKEFATLLFDVERFKKVSADKAALRIKNGKPATILDAMQLADQAWNAISSRSITNCFLTTHCLPESMQEQIRSPPASSSQLRNEGMMLKLMPLLTCLSTFKLVPKLQV